MTIKDRGDVQKKVQVCNLWKWNEDLAFKA